MLMPKKGAAYDMPKKGVVNVTLEKGAERKLLKKWPRRPMMAQEGAMENEMSRKSCSLRTFIPLGGM